MYTFSDLTTPDNPSVRIARSTAPGLALGRLSRRMAASILRRPYRPAGRIFRSPRLSGCHTSVRIASSTSASLTVLAATTRRGEVHIR